jgi:hypothetical protein
MLKAVNLLFLLFSMSLKLGTHVQHQLSITEKEFANTWIKCLINYNRLFGIKVYTVWDSVSLLI